MTGPVLPRRDVDAVAARLGALAAWRHGARLAVAVAPVAAVTGLLSDVVAARVLGAARGSAWPPTARTSRPPPRARRPSVQECTPRRGRHAGRPAA
jgi:hypothetical protein